MGIGCWFYFFIDCLLFLGERVVVKIRFVVFYFEVRFVKVEIRVGLVLVYRL